MVVRKLQIGPDMRFAALILLTLVSACPSGRNRARLQCSG